MKRKTAQIIKYKRSLINAIIQEYRLHLIDESMQNNGLNDITLSDHYSFKELIEIAKVPKSDNTLKELKIHGVQYFVEHILKQTPESFYENFPNEDIRKYSLDKLMYSIFTERAEIGRDIIDKEVLFNKIWPDKFSNDDYSPLHRVFYSDDQFIKRLCSHMDPNSDSYDESTTIIIYNILRDAIEYVIYNELDLSTTEEIFGFLADQSIKFYNKDPRAAGINTIISKTPSAIKNKNYFILDFYYSTFSLEAQKKYSNEFKIAKYIVLHRINSE